MLISAAEILEGTSEMSETELVFCKDAELMWRCLTATLSACPISGLTDGGLETKFGAGVLARLKDMEALMLSRLE